MLNKTKDLLKKIKTILIENEYVTADVLAQKCHLSTKSIYRAIRFLRIEGIGIIPTKKGYVLSEFAKKTDDVFFIRRCFGRRTSDIIALSAIEKDVRLRWSGVEDKNNINNVLKYLSIKPQLIKNASKNVTYLLSSVNGKGN